MSLPSSSDQHRSVQLAAIAVFAGCLAVLFTDVVTVLIVDDLGLVSDTISNAAAGRWAWIQDTGLCILGLGLWALAYGLWRTGPGGWRRWLSVIAILIVGAAVIVLALHDEYGDGDRGGCVFHIELVYLIGSAMLVPMALQAASFGETRKIFRPLSWLLFVLWLVGGPLLFQIPTAYDGLYERGLAAIMLAWVLMAGRVLWLRSKGPEAYPADGPNLVLGTRR